MKFLKIDRKKGLKSRSPQQQWQQVKNRNREAKKEPSKSREE
jgi:hypothetical protein